MEKSKFKPMLSGKLGNLEDVQYPVLVSPKLDGIRCLIVDGRAVSRSLKPIPNKYIQKRLSSLPNGLDGELILEGKDFNTTQSAVMSVEGEPEFVYAVFDSYLEDQPFSRRLLLLTDFINNDASTKEIHVVPHVVVNDSKDLLKHYNGYMAEGFEGLMVRSPDGPYKYGRSTTREGYLLKLKTFKDDEASVIGFTERLHNTNEQKRDALGYAERSSAKAGKVGMDTLGALQVEWNGVQFEIGTGFSDEERQTVWDNKDVYDGELVKFKYQELSAKGVPRFPVFLGFRHKDDL